MGKKAEVGTPKYIANKMKAKGLQKLRWYCQMCSKQCRDENGFKCHTMSESHQRQLLLFAENPHKMMDEFSKEFATGYLEILKRQFGTKRVAANRVYQEYISFKEHLHMNATKWVTLTGFVKWMGREGHCTVDETEKGWFITYIDRDPDTIAFQERMAKKKKMDKDDTERMESFLKKQIERGQAMKSEPAPETIKVEDVDLTSEERDKIKIDIFVKPKAPIKIEDVKEPVKKRPHDEEKKERKKVKSDTKPSSALDEIMQQEENEREKRNRKDHWLCEGIVVKVMTKTLGDDFYKQKGVVREVLDKYTAIVSMFELKKKLKIDQAHLETVIPSVGRKVMVVNGAYRGSRAVLLKINEAKFNASIEIDSGLLKGRRVDGLNYEDICKLDC